MFVKIHATGYYIVGHDGVECDVLDTPGDSPYNDEFVINTDKIVAAWNRKGSTRIELVGGATVFCYGDVLDQLFVDHNTRD